MLLEDDADWVIVGTGAGGATAARVLSETGSVVMIEEGAQLDTRNRPRAMVHAMRQAFRDMGTNTTLGAHPLPILQGRCVGGSTAINSAIVWRLPDDVRLDWAQRFGLDDLVEERALDRIFTQIEDEIHVKPTSEEVLGKNGLLMKKGALALGLPGKPIHRNAGRCEGRGECLQGCPNENRQSMDVSYVPRALRAGARLHALARAQRLVFEGRRAVGVEGDLLDDDRKKKGTFRIRARKGVIVAASVIYTPVLLRRSGLGGLVGDRLQLHPGSAVVGRFPEPVGMGFGATQGYEIPQRERGYKIESLSLPPEMLAARLPGAGVEWQRRLAELDHYAQWAVQVRMKAHGTVRPAGNQGEAAIHYTPLRDDLRRLKEGLVTICRMFFAAGATEVLPGIGRLPVSLTDPSQVDLIERADIEQKDLHMMASHLFGTAVAGRDAATSVVGPDLQHHEVRGLYVMDASVFPTNLGVNPQHSIMGIVWRAAERLAEVRSQAA